MSYILVFAMYGPKPVCIMALYGSVFTSSRFKGQRSVKQAPGPALRALTEPKVNTSRDRLVVRTLRCGRSNPGSNPGHGMFFSCHEIKMRNENPHIFCRQKSN
jgi:hypothetical protein